MIASLMTLTMLNPMVLEVGPGKLYVRIEDAVAKAKPGDTINIYPDPKGYPKTAARIQSPSITIRGIAPEPVAITGDGFDYSGSGTVSRAIFQFEPSATGSTIANLDISGAHNASFNGAGVRIQATNGVKITDCIIHENDMGIMSNGKQGDPQAGSDQLIAFCLIEKNGNVKEPGYNHNLYLGGTNVTLFHCEIRNSITGHNVKSRAHYTQIEACYIHDAANREIDLSEAWDTTRANSNAVLINNRIVKDPNCKGNRGVIHFGNEKGTRIGNLYLLCNTIVTPFASPVVLVTSENSAAIAEQNVILNNQQGKAEFWSSSVSGTKLVANFNSLSVAYAGLVGSGNQFSDKRSETFGISTPTYLFPLGHSTGKVRQISWVDGEGKPITVHPSRDDPSRFVGPRDQKDFD